MSNEAKEYYDKNRQLLPPDPQKYPTVCRDKRMFSPFFIYFKFFITLSLTKFFIYICS